MFLLGEIVYLHAFGTDMVYINSRRLAYELFERRSSIYSDRPNFPMIVDLYVLFIVLIGKGIDSLCIECGDGNGQ